MKLLSKIFFLLFSISCASQPQKLQTEIFYKRDIQININGKEIDGVGVVPMSNEYKIEIEAKGDLDLFTLSTCHREIANERAWNSGLFPNKRKTKVNFKPTEIEIEDYCPMMLGGYEITKGRHSWGVVDFKTKEETLDARLICNGVDSNFNGVSICQAKEGLLQRIIFNTEVTVDPDEDCQLPILKGKIFEFSIKKGLCVYAFKGQNKELHRLTTVGYEHIMLRQ